MVQHRERVAQLARSICPCVCQAASVIRKSPGNTPTLGAQPAAGVGETNDFRETDSKPVAPMPFAAGNLSGRNVSRETQEETEA
jgi:hypothetical protein